MACKLDIKNTILDDINSIFIEGRYTYYRVNEDTFRIANAQETKDKSRAKSLNQAREIALEVRNRILNKYGNNVMVEIIMPEYLGFPVELKVTPNDLYVEKLYAQVKPEKRTEYVSRIAFLQDPALFQQELIEDEPLKMIPYEAWAAQNRAPNPIIDEKGQIKFFQQVSDKGIVATEKTIRDLAARMSDRIGIPFQIISDRTQKFKGKIENNVAIINLAYATLDTPIHEILGHPIIRTIKNKYKTSKFEVDEDTPFGGTLKEEDGYSQLYTNLLKELEYGKGKEVLDRVKKNYIEKEIVSPIGYRLKYIEYITGYKGQVFDTKKEALDFLEKQGDKGNLKLVKNVTDEDIPIENQYIKYTLEEQQEEAIVELLGLYTAGKIDATKNLKLVSLLKQLLGRIKAFVRDLLFQKEVEIDKLPDNMTIGDIADLLAYSNNKLILPGNEVVYTTPDNQQFKTYAEASKHISELAKSVEDVDLSNVKVQKEKVDSVDEILVDRFEVRHDDKLPSEYVRIDGKWYQEISYTPEYYGDPGIQHYLISDDKILSIFNSPEQIGVFKSGINILGFIQKNREYEKSKEIIEEWKKVNNIQYNPEEIYSRGQEFSSVVGAYSDFDVNLMMQNLLQHIEDNEKAGGKFAISAFTKPIDRTIGHLEGGGGKIKFKIYPQSNDILWASNIDVYSGSVWDASKKVNKDKKSELLGVSYTKYPSLRNVNTVQPNLASIIDDLAHHHNELGITLTGNNFRLEYDDNIPYTTKKIIDSVNSILDQKYGKLVKPEINLSDKSKKTFVVTNWDIADIAGVETKEFNSLKEAEDFIQSEKIKYNLLNTNSYQIDEKYTKQGIQPTQTNETLKESIESVKSKNTSIKENQWAVEPYAEGEYAVYTYMGKFVEGQPTFKSLEEAEEWLRENQPKEKEYTSQALINTKIAKLKEVAKKYPRSLIRSEVKPIFGAFVGFPLQPFDPDELPFQKVPGGNIEKSLENGNTFNMPIFEIPDVMASILYQNNNCK